MNTSIKHFVDHSYWLGLAISKFDTLTLFSSEMGVTPQVASNWVRRKRIPLEYAPHIEKILCGAVKLEQLYPGINWGVRRFQPEVGAES